jgi:hypothetical protein
VVQTDVAINQGNSGGPLLAKEGKRYYWIGINTWVMGRDQGMQGINFTISLAELQAGKFRWYDATKEGTAAALREVYQFPTGQSTISQ